MIWNQIAHEGDAPRLGTENRWSDVSQWENGARSPRPARDESPSWHARNLRSQGHDSCNFRGEPTNWSIYLYASMYVCMYIYMVVDLKVLVRSFNCESRACCVGNPRESFSSSSRKRISYSRRFRESWILWIMIIIIAYIAACSGLPPPAPRGPGVRQENGTAHLPIPS